MQPSKDTFRVLQLHPTLRCNLRCLHCYSSSGPEAGEELEVELLRRALIDASVEGYNVAGFSGGEPLLYRHLGELLEQAQACGMITTVTSNGMLLDRRRIETLRGSLDLLAISLDGVPESHNRMRGSARAFETMRARLDGVRESGIPFGFIFTLTQHNLHELEWVAQFAVNQGARLLQIHPLEIVGRAREVLPRFGPDEVERAYSVLETARIRSIIGDRLRVQLDLVDTRRLRDEPDRVFAGNASMDVTACRLGEVVAPLVIEADGTVVPIQHGFARAYALGNLHDAPLGELAVSWKRDRYHRFRELCRQVFKEITVPSDLPFANWYEVLGHHAERSAQAWR